MARICSGRHKPALVKLPLLRFQSFNKSLNPDRASDREHGQLIDLGDATKVWFDVQDVDGDMDLDTILYKTEDRSEIYGVLADYNGRVTDLWNRKLDADFFIDTTIEVMDLDAPPPDII